jgi:hypothetical protein
MVSPGRYVRKYIIELSNAGGTKESYIAFRDHVDRIYGRASEWVKNDSARPSACAKPAKASKLLKEYLDEVVQKISNDVTTVIIDTNSRDKLIRYADAIDKLRCPASLNSINRRNKSGSHSSTSNNSSSSSSSSSNSSNSSVHENRSSSTDSDTDEEVVSVGIDHNGHCFNFIFLVEYLGTFK